MKTSIIKTFQDELHPEETVRKANEKQISEHIVFRPSTNSIQGKRIKLMNAVKVVVNVIVNVRGNVEFERDITIDKFFEL